MCWKSHPLNVKSDRSKVLASVGRNFEQIGQRWRMAKIAFILVSGFPLMSFSATLEPLRAANHISNQKLFDLSLHSDGGGWVSSSGGMAVETQDLPQATEDLSHLFVVAGGHV